MIELIYKKKPILISLVKVVAFLLVLMFPALYNTYPIIFRDSYHYMSFESSLHHPIYYGFIVGGLAKLIGSVYFFVFLNSLCVSTILFLFFKYCMKNCNSLQSVVALCLISASTLPYLASTIMPDYLFGVGTISSLLLIFKWNEIKHNKVHLILISLLFVFSSISHNLNWVVNFSLFIILFPLKNGFKKERTLHLFYILICFVNISLISFDYFYRDSKGSSNGISHFIVGTAAEEGFLENRLVEICKSKDLKICRSQKSIPTGSDEFLWGAGPHSMLNIYSQKSSYVDAWKVANSELKYIARKLVLNDLDKFFMHSFKRLYRMSFLTNYNNEVRSIHPPQATFTSLYIKYGDSYQSLLEKPQFKDSYDFYFMILKYAFNICFVFLLIFLAFEIYFKKVKEYRYSFFILGTFLLSNYIAANISTPMSRYQVLSAWLIPMLLISKLRFFLRSRFLHLFWNCTNLKL